MPPPQKSFHLFIRSDQCDMDFSGWVGYKQDIWSRKWGAVWCRRISVGFFYQKSFGIVTSSLTCLNLRFLICGMGTGVLRNVSTGGRWSRVNHMPDRWESHSKESWAGWQGPRPCQKEKVSLPLPVGWGNICERGWRFPPNTTWSCLQPEEQL